MEREAQQAGDARVEAWERRARAHLREAEAALQEARAYREAAAACHQRVEALEELSEACALVGRLEAESGSAQRARLASEEGERLLRHAAIHRKVAERYESEVRRVQQEVERARAESAAMHSRADVYRGHPTDAPTGP